MGRKYPPLPKSTKVIHTVPVIIREWKDEYGTRLYESNDHKTFDADTYDEVFVPTKLKVLPKFTPDSSISLSREFQQRKGR